MKEITINEIRVGDKVNYQLDGRQYKTPKRVIEVNAYNVVVPAGEYKSLVLFAKQITHVNGEPCQVINSREKATYTRGPWRVSKETTRCIDGSEVPSYIESDTAGIAIIKFDAIRGISGHEATANAHLLAATPEMLKELKESLEALKESTEHLPVKSRLRFHVNEVCKRMQSVINKAEDIHDTEQ